MAEMSINEYIESRVDDQINWYDEKSKKCQNWIDYEIDTAVNYGKYIIGLKPWGQERIPQKISLNADIMVGWNRPSLISAIKNT